MPYAYGAKIRHEFLVDHLNVWVTFRHPMQRSEIPQAEPPVYDWMPPLNLWLLEADDVPVDITASAWQDQFTLLLTSDTIVDTPDRVLLEYAGPDEHLCTTWGKDWEPWGPILSTDIVKFPCFVDRGDTDVWDFHIGDLTADGNWHDMDLSGIVPEGAKAVLIQVGVKDNLVNQSLFLRRDGNVNTINSCRWKTMIADMGTVYDAVCPISDDRKLEYLLSNVVWTVVDIVVKGWWF